MPARARPRPPTLSLSRGRCASARPSHPPCWPHWQVIEILSSGEEGDEESILAQDAAVWAQAKRTTQAKARAAAGSGSRAAGKQLQQPAELPKPRKKSREPAGDAPQLGPGDYGGGARIKKPRAVAASGDAVGGAVAGG